MAYLALGVQEAYRVRPEVTDHLVQLVRDLVRGQICARGRQRRERHEIRVHVRFLDGPLRSHEGGGAPGWKLEDSELRRPDRLAVEEHLCFF